MRVLNSREAAIDQILEKRMGGEDLIRGRVEEILNRVREQGDKAVFAFTRQFDGAVISKRNFRVSSRELAAARSRVDREFLAALELAAANIREFHQKQKPHSWMEPDDRGNLLGQVLRPLRRVGIYVPGGTAAYPSTVLMNALPAQVAGVKEIVMVSPPDAEGLLNPYTLAAAEVCGIKEIYKVGGAQAIGALAFGTESLPRVDKITGQGNIYVTLAKKLVYGTVDIDMLAGPSEVLIIADHTARPEYVAADLLSQAEHDPMASALLLTPSLDLARAVSQEVKQQLAGLTRREIIQEAIDNYGAIVVTRDLEEAVALSNRFAPEHLELMVDEPFTWLGKIENAGAIFIGPYSPEPIGDYVAGPNHILPTGGTARFYSPVTVDTFIKKSSVIAYSARGLAAVADAAIKLASVEGLDAHASSIRVRKGDD